MEKLAMWVFMLVCNLIVPLVMIGFGRLFEISPPREINNGFGYRTKRSMKNQDTWDFAQRCMGKVWWKIGWVMLPLVVFGQALTLLCPTAGSMNLWSFVLMGLEVVVGLPVSILPIERALKQNFDKDGNRISESP